MSIYMNTSIPTSMRGTPTLMSTIITVSTAHMNMTTLHTTLRYMIILTSP